MLLVDQRLPIFSSPEINKFTKPQQSIRPPETTVPCGLIIIY